MQNKNQSTGLNLYDLNNYEKTRSKQNVIETDKVLKEIVNGKSPESSKYDSRSILKSTFR